MYQINWGDLTPELFLEEYWQKKPLLIKNAFTDFQDPIDANELAGLAMEEQLQSRIICQPQANEWQVHHGPFEDFSEFGEKNWTLLVQAVNNWSDQTDELLKCYKFLPAWRLDDVMVSYSTPNGGVGPHLDQYDVFIIQGMGKRRWQVGLPDNSLATLLPHEDLKQVSDFQPVIDNITTAGDLLYIPPNHPHNGVAIDNSLNFSIGFQAPSSQELWSGFADKLIDKQLGEQRFADPDRKVTNQAHILNHQDVTALKAYMLEQLADEHTFNQFIGEQLTHCQHELELLPLEPQITEDELLELINSEQITISPVLGIKTLLTDPQSTTQANMLFVCGEHYEFEAELTEFIELITNKEKITHNTLKTWASRLKNLSLLTTLLNKGYWYIDQSDDV